MSVDWNNLSNNLDAAVQAAAGQTDAQLAGQVATLTTLSPAEIQQMYPNPADAQKLAQLMQLVQSATSQNDKINQLVANAQTFGGIILPLIQKFAKIV